MNDDTQTRDTVVGGDPDRPSPGRTGRACPTCGSSNASGREVCRTCGADVVTGEPLPWPEPDPDPDVQVLQLATAPNPRRWWLAVAAILAAITLLLLGLVIAELGPFASTTTVPEATFASDRYDGETQDLLLSDIATVSTMPPRDGRSFEAARMVDDDPATSWRSDGLLEPEEVNGSREIVDLFLTEPSWISAIVLRNGDQSDLGVYQEAARLRRVRAIADGGEVVMLNLLDDGRGQQVVELPDPVLSTMLRLEVVEVFPGTDGQGVAVSDLEVRGWTAIGDDPALAAERAELQPATAPLPYEVRQSL
ncbi:MAG: hypothetical protein LC679_19865 [Intrasporangiaceae bacterium]|nr:hypothetical protein [Intrasporangiaceae bacterium]